MAKRPASASGGEKSAKRGDFPVILLTPSLGSGDLRFPPDLSKRALLPALARCPPGLSVTLAGECSVLSSFLADHSLGIDFVECHGAEQGDLTKLLSSLSPRVLVVECNWRFAPKANRLSSAVHALIGESGPTAICAGGLSGVKEAPEGKTFPIAVPQDSPLRVLHGIEYIIYVRPPNLNPSRPGENKLRKIWP